MGRAQALWGAAGAVTRLSKSTGGLDRLGAVFNRWIEQDMMRLRQIALVTPELRPVEQDICNQLGLEVRYRDLGLAHFGLRHGLYAIGDQLLEVVATKQPGTTAGRFFERRGGEGGYMILLQTDDVEQHKSRVESAVCVWSTTARSCNTAPT